MSIAAFFVPLGMAVIAAVSAASARLEEEGRTELTPIRVADPQLVARSLEALGATDVSVTEETVTARTSVGEFHFERVGGVMAGVLLGADQEASSEAVRKVEDKAGHLAQQRTAALAKSQAEELGFTLIEETTEQGTINYVFEEK